MQLAERIKEEVWRRRARGVRSYQIARSAQVDPTTLSGMLHGAIPIHADDPRVVRLARVLGLSVEDVPLDAESIAS